MTYEPGTPAPHTAIITLPSLSRMGWTWAVGVVGGVLLVLILIALVGMKQERDATAEPRPDAETD